MRDVCDNRFREVVLSGGDCGGELGGRSSYVLDSDLNTDVFFVNV